MMKQGPGWAEGGNVRKPNLVLGKKKNKQTQSYVGFSSKDCFVWEEKKGFVASLIPNVDLESGVAF